MTGDFGCTFNIDVFASKRVFEIRVDSLNTASVIVVIAHRRIESHLYKHLVSFNRYFCLFTISGINVDDRGVPTFFRERCNWLGVIGFITQIIKVINPLGSFINHRNGDLWIVYAGTRIDCCNGNIPIHDTQMEFSSNPRITVSLSVYFTSDVGRGWDSRGVHG